MVSLPDLDYKDSCLPTPNDLAWSLDQFEGLVHTPAILNIVQQRSLSKVALISKCWFNIVFAIASSKGRIIVMRIADFISGFDAQGSAQGRARVAKTLRLLKLVYDAMKKLHDKCLEDGVPDHQRAAARDRMWEIRTNLFSSHQNPKDYYTVPAELREVLKNFLQLEEANSKDFNPHNVAVHYKPRGSQAPGTNGKVAGIFDAHMLNLKETALQILDGMFQVETYEGQATLSYAHGLTPISPIGFDVLWPNLYGTASKYLTMSEVQAVKPPYLRWDDNHMPASKKSGGRIYVSLQTPLATIKHATNSYESMRVLNAALEQGTDVPQTKLTQLKEKFVSEMGMIEGDHQMPLLIGTNYTTFQPLAHTQPFYYTGLACPNPITFDITSPSGASAVQSAIFHGIMPAASGDYPKAYPIENLQCPCQITGCVPNSLILPNLLFLTQRPNNMIYWCGFLNSKKGVHLPCGCTVCYPSLIETYQARMLVVAVIPRTPLLAVKKSRCFQSWRLTITVHCTGQGSSDPHKVEEHFREGFACPYGCKLSKYSAAMCEEYIKMGGADQQVALISSPSSGKKIMKKRSSTASYISPEWLEGFPDAGYACLLGTLLLDAKNNAYLCCSCFDKHVALDTHPVAVWSSRVVCISQLPPNVPAEDIMTWFDLHLRQQSAAPGFLASSSINVGDQSKVFLFFEQQSTMQLATRIFTALANDAGEGLRTGDSESWAVEESKDEAQDDNFSIVVLPINDAMAQISEGTVHVLKKARRLEFKPDSEVDVEAGARDNGKLVSVGIGSSQTAAAAGAGASFMSLGAGSQGAASGAATNSTGPEQIKSELAKPVKVKLEEAPPMATAEDAMNMGTGPSQIPICLRSKDAKEDAKGWYSRYSKYHLQSPDSRNACVMLTPAKGSAIYFPLHLLLKDCPLLTAKGFLGFTVEHYNEKKDMDNRPFKYWWCIFNIKCFFDCNENMLAGHSFTDAWLGEKVKTGGSMRLVIKDPWGNDIPTVSNDYKEHPNFVAFYKPPPYNVKAMHARGDSCACPPRSHVYACRHLTVNPIRFRRWRRRRSNYLHRGRLRHALIGKDGKIRAPLRLVNVMVNLTSGNALGHEYSPCMIMCNSSLTAVLTRDGQEGQMLKEALTPPGPQRIKGKLVLGNKQSRGLPSVMFVVTTYRKERFLSSKDGECWPVVSWGRRVSPANSSDTRYRPSQQSSSEKWRSIVRPVIDSDDSYPATKAPMADIVSKSKCAKPYAAMACGDNLTHAAPPPHQTPATHEISTHSPLFLDLLAHHVTEQLARRHRNRFRSAGFFRMQLVTCPERGRPVSEKGRLLKHIRPRWKFVLPRVCSASSVAPLVGLGASESHAASGRTSNGAARPSGQPWKRHRTQSDIDGKKSAANAQKAKAMKSPTKVFRCYSCNIRGFNEQKFRSVLAYVAPHTPDALVFSETNLTFTHTPDYVESLGWRAYTVCGPKKCGSRAGDNSGGVSLFIREGAFSVKQKILMQNDSHQVANWDLSDSDRGFTPRIRISGAYFAPRPKVPLQRTIAAFNHLKVEFLLPTPPTAQNPYSTQYHIVTGDFNAYCGSVQETHITQDQASRIPVRVGDPNHTPRSSVDEHSNTTEPEQRGFLLLRFVNELSLLITNGRFERHGAPVPLTTTTTIVDYFCVHKDLFGDVDKCQIFHDSTKQGQNFGTGSDHKLMLLSLNLPFNATKDTRDANQQTGQREPKAPRRLYFTEKLKDQKVAKEFRQALERESPECHTKIAELQAKHDAQKMTTQVFIDQSHELFVSMIQAIAEKVLSSPSPFHYPGGAQKQRGTDARQHHTPPNLQQLLKDIQCLKDDLKLLKRTECMGQDDPMWAEMTTKTTQLHQLKLNLAEERQRALDQDISGNIREVSLSLEQDHLKTAWAIWRHYKSSIATDGCHGLPSLMKTNRLAATDPSRWVAGDIAKSPKDGAEAWSQHRYAVGSDLRNHPWSPWDERAADQVEAALSAPHPSDVLPDDPLLNAPFTVQELSDHLKRLPPDKATGPDGISNRMLQSGGDAFLALLYCHLSNIWDTCVWPEAWASSLMQPIYKGDGKDRYDPASYRGIFLSNITLKLLEGVMEGRLKTFTEKYDTLTPQQQGSRPGRQRHDAIYSLIAAVQLQKKIPQTPPNDTTPSPGASYCAFLDFTTAYPSVHRERLALVLKECGITGKMWQLLRENSRRIRVRVLHPLIPATKEVEIMRGLPEGSRLSPILFAMLAADLIRDLRTQFPDVTMPSVSVLVWIGTIFYVDDAIIIARSPSQLQAMLNRCQQWAEKNRLSINVNKTKVMVFFENPTVRAARQRFRFTLSPSFPTPLDPKTHILTKIAQRYRRHTALQPAEFAVVPPNTLGVVESTDMSGLSVVDFPTIGRVEIRKADLGHISLVPVEVDEFKYLGLILDHLLTMDAAATAGVKQIEFAHSKLAATLHSLRQLPRRQTHSALSPAMRLQMWRSCVHTHALENLRYLRTKGQIQRWQSAVSLSLKKSFLHFEQPLPMSLDLGVPPLDLVQALQLVKLHFRYSYDSPSTMQAHLYSLQRQWKHKFSTDAIVNRIEQAFDTLSLTSQYPSLQQVPQSVSDLNTKHKKCDKHMGGDAKAGWLCDLNGHGMNGYETPCSDYP